MSSNENYKWDDELDSLSPYEIAVLAFTSPRAVEGSDDHESIVTVTSKESYIWAAAIAHAVMWNPELNEETVLRALRNSVESAVRQSSDYFLGFDLKDRRWISNRLIDGFFSYLGIRVQDVDEIRRRAEHAVRSLVWKGYIEDPFSKKIAAISLAVLMVTPVGFTSAGENAFRLNALTWEYSQKPEGHNIQRQMRIKAGEIATAVMNKIVPTFIDAVRQLSGDDGKTAPPDEIQKSLKNRGYYHGAIDGKVGPQTATALRHFQNDHYLEQTGYPDQATLSALGLR